MLSYFIVCYHMLFVAFCYIVLFYVILCYLMLCCLCYLILSYVIRCYLVLSIPFYSSLLPINHYLFIHPSIHPVMLAI